MSTSKMGTKTKKTHTALTAENIDVLNRSGIRRPYVAMDFGKPVARQLFEIFTMLLPVH